MNQKPKSDHIARAHPKVNSGLTAVLKNRFICLVFACLLINSALAQTAPSITNQPASGSYAVGSVVTVSVTASGTSPLFYQWYKDGILIPQANLNYITFDPLSATDAGTYTVVVTNTYGTATSSTATINTNGQGTSFAIYCSSPTTIIPFGSPFTYSATWTNANFSYNNYDVNGLYIEYVEANNTLTVDGFYPSAGTFNYTVANVSSADDGMSLYLECDGGNGYQQYAPAILHVSPGITTQPTNTTCANNTTISLGLVAGPTTASYQWISASSGSILASSPTFTATTTMNGQMVYCRVYNTYGQALSAPVMLNVGTAPTISSQPSSATVAAGQNATFTVTAAGTATLSYTWFFNGTPLSGAALNSIGIDGVTPANSGSYVCIVTNAYGTVTSSTATLTVNNAFPTITSQPTNQTIVLGQNATFTVGATGANPLTYSWYFNGVAILGANRNSITIANATNSDAGFYSCAISNSNGVTNTISAPLSFGTYPAITTQLQSLTVTQGQTATFMAAASGSPLNYYWFYNSTPINGATSTNYTIPNVTPANAGNYTFVASNGLGSVSSFATLTVLYPPVISVQPTNQIIGINSNFSVTVSATGSPAVAYQWFLNSNSIAGATNTTYRVTNAQLTDGGNYDVVVSNQLGSLTSSVASVNVAYYPPVITSQPVGQNVQAGTAATLSVTANGSLLNYVWYHVSTNSATAVPIVTNGFVVGATVTMGGSGYTSIPNIQIMGAGGSGAAASATLSNGVVVAVNIIAPGSGYTNGVAINIDPIYAPMAGQTNSLLSLATVTTNNAGNFFVTVSNASGSVTSSNANLTVYYNPPVITMQPTGIIVNAGSNATFAVQATGSLLTYQWWEQLPTVATAVPVVASNMITSILVTNGGAGYTTIPNVVITDTNGSGAMAAAVVSNGVVTAIILLNQGSGYSSQTSVQIDPPTLALTGQTNTTFTITGASTTNAGNYFVMVANAVGNVASSTAGLVVDIPVYITAQPQSQTVTNGGNATFSVGVNGTGPFGYQWYYLPNSSLATAAALTLNEFVYGANVSNGGSGYISTPNVQVIGGGGSGATASATVSNGVVVAVNIITTGSGYTNTPNIQINPPPGNSINNQTNAVLGIAGATTNSSGSYFVVVMDDWGNVTSTLASLAITSISSSNTLQPPLAATIAATLSGGQMALRFKGSTNRNYALQFTTNLAPPITWQSILTNTSDANGNWEFTDTNLNSSQKFYRAIGQ